jgi:hypothetical protein
MVGPTKVNLRDLSREGEEVSVSSAEGVWQLGLAHRNAPHRDDFHLVLADATAFASDVLQYAQLGTVEEFGFPDSARLQCCLTTSRNRKSICMNLFTTTDKHQAAPVGQRLSKEVGNCYIAKSNFETSYIPSDADFNQLRAEGKLIPLWKLPTIGPELMHDVCGVGTWEEVPKEHLQMVEAKFQELSHFFHCAMLSYEAHDNDRMDPYNGHHFRRLAAALVIEGNPTDSARKGSATYCYLLRCRPELAVCHTDYIGWVVLQLEGLRGKEQDDETNTTALAEHLRDRPHHAQCDEAPRTLALYWKELR